MIGERAKLVVGFMFCGCYVLLVQKQKPVWQKDLWNGVGGKVEPNEAPIQAIVREVKEEAGLDTQPATWMHFASEIGRDYHLFCYRAIASAPSGDLLPPSVPKVNDADEPLRWVKTDTLYGYHKIGNLNWLIPLALDWRRHFPVEMQVYDDIRTMAQW